MTRARDLSPRGRRSWLRSVAILGLAVAPAIGVGARALAGEPRGKRHDRGRDADESGETVEQARKRVLASMPVDAASLINVGGRELPASPDVLALGRRGVTALTRCLADNTDADVRRRCAAMLGRIGDKRALPAMHAALDDWEPSVRTAVATALERMPDPSSVAPLVKLFARKDEEDANRVVVLRALGAETHRSAVAVLRQVLADKDAAHELKLTAFQGVWRSRHVMARETLVSDVGAALGSPNDDLVIAAVVAAAELRSPRLTAALTPLLDHKNANVRNKAVYALGLIGDRAATKTLLAKLPSVRDGRMLNNIAFALERLDREAFFTSRRSSA
jgi:HEAT repeat protein